MSCELNTDRTVDQPIGPIYRRTRFRRLRIAVATVSAVLCALLVVAWWRSYFVHDNLVYPFEEQAVTASWYDGALYLGTLHNWRSLPFDASDGVLRMRHWPIDRNADWMASIREKNSLALGFGVIDSSSELVVFAPFWFLWTLSGLIAVIAWPEKSRQFRVRTLLIATALVAVVLGLAAYAARL